MKKYLSAIIIFTIIFITYIFIFFAILDEGGMNVTATSGAIDLTSFEFNERSFASITGESEFYWNEFIYSDNEESKKNPLIISLDSSWNQEDNAELDGKGHGSYRMMIKMEPVDNLAIKLSDVLTSYRLYWNGRLLGDLGQIGENEASSVPMNRPSTYMIGQVLPVNELVIEVSDYHLGKGGINNPIKVGSKSALDLSTFENIAMTLFIVGTFITLFFVLMLENATGGSSFVNRSLIFILFVFSIRAITVGERLILYVMDDLSWTSIYRIENISIVLIAAVILRIIRYSVEDALIIRLSIGISWLARGLLITLITLPPNVVMGYTKYFLYVIILSVVVVTIRIFYAKLYTRLLTRFSLYSLFALMSAVILDVFIQFDGVLGADITELGFLIFTYIMIFAGYRDNRENVLIRERLQNELIEKNTMLEEFNQKLERRVQQRTQELEEKNSLLKDMSQRDGLTGLFNYRTIHQIAQKYFDKKNKNEMCIVMIDLDYFKDINDNYGHMMGDEVLIEFGRFMTENTRSEDVIGRYGGEEFIIVQYGIDLESAYAVIDRLREQVSQLVFGDEKVQITFSAGMESGKNVTTLEELVKKADKKLYEAKNTGRNKVVS
ncbi:MULTISPECIES: GGDEF domain-containing protein [unclassified Fusibacter]|uniref:GGDEF domain-containing protein n=1 Tax=unclassified Fusibacter TaxID=2624464 RepID=UPI001010F66E|nr:MULTISPECIES: diguanylate cyclase [unclassified Fusibacter]MCK8058132.1 diguanylate cyclase [Fusibacter sp. A2]NPE20714.1 diguanylate cyclase [Fusibacter sp. A1]RXV62918.1 diguanylate cyclase [Fusibacter sp. A1]